MGLAPGGSQAGWLSPRMMVCVSTTGSGGPDPKPPQGTAMDYYAGIDVSLEQSSVCVVDANGKIVREAKVSSEPEVLAAFFRDLGLSLTRIGLEAGPLSQWLHAGLVAAGFTVVLLETRHVKAALSAMTVKTDRKDVPLSDNWTPVCACSGGEGQSLL